MTTRRRSFFSCLPLESKESVAHSHVKKRKNARGTSSTRRSRTRALQDLSPPRVLDASRRTSRRVPRRPRPCLRLGVGAPRARARRGSPGRGR